MEITRHFTATIMVVFDNKILLHMHKNLSLWLPVGGHIDRDELPEEAALREAKEESGLDVEIYKPDKSVEMGDVVELLRPMHILLENINEFHQHIDLVYYGKANTSKLMPGPGEATNIKWFTKKELETLVGLPKNALKLSIEALNLLKD